MKYFVQSDYNRILFFISKYSSPRMANTALNVVLMVTMMMAFLVNQTCAECCHASVWFPKDGSNTHRVACDDLTHGKIEM